MGLERSSIRSSSSSSPSSCSSSARSRRKFTLFHTLVVLFICFVCAITTTIAPSLSSPYIRNSYSRKRANFYAKEEEGEGMRRRRRRLRGLGSSPPRCNGKCERCAPCKPVHVPVPPGSPVTAEYYPEAWRCKCGNKLYLP